MSNTAGDTTAADFAIIGVGLCYASACTSATDDEAAARLNAAHPTGVAPWHVSNDSHFAGGEHTNPCPCAANPGTHRHVLFEC